MTAPLEANDVISQNGNAFFRSLVVPHWDGAPSLFYLYNPAASGVDVMVDFLLIAVGGAPHYGCDVRKLEGSYGTLAGYGFSKKFDCPDSKAELRWGNSNYEELPSQQLVQEGWMGAVLNDKCYRYAPPIILPPNWGVLVVSANSADLCVSTQFREYART